MTREQYITDKLDSIRVSALESARNTFSDNTVRVYLKRPEKARIDREGIKEDLDSFEKIYRESGYHAGVFQDLVSKYGADIETVKNKWEAYLKETSPYFADRYKQYQEAVKRGDYIEAANCIANLSRFYPHGLPTGNQTFRANPAKYGFKEIDTWDVKPGDLVQSIDKNMIPEHAMMYNGQDTEGKHSFNYSSGYGPGSWGVGKHFPDAVHPDKKHLNDVYVYRYVGTPQDSIQWTNEWLQSQQAKNFNIGGKINYLTVFKNE